MRLWHEKLIPLLPRQQLLGLHREVCALRGNGWGKKHATVDYVFTHPYAWLIAYHVKIIKEMTKRGYTVNGRWFDLGYRGAKTLHFNKKEEALVFDNIFIHDFNTTIYPEHNEAYLQECLDNLASKGIIINREDIK